MKRTYPKKVSEIIEAALEHDGDADLLARQRASFAWCEIVGEGVNRYTSRRYVTGSTLHVYLTSAPLKHELSFHTASIMKSINSAVGRDVINEIIIH
ncbi:MAG: DUF721 domain-containing protein [Paramuribaculum sp.]|nr:DUF721 domain-containing protein [Paramuribaculum sp.]